MDGASTRQAGARPARHGNGLRLVLDDGRPVNILHSARLEGLRSLVEGLCRSPGAAPAWLLFEGNEAGSFAAGADLRQIARLDPLGARELSSAGERLARAIAQAPFPVGCLVDGHAVGGGFDLVVACDLTVATDRAWFSHPGIGRGFFTGWGGTDRIPASIRGRRGAHALLTGRRIGAREAERIGLLAGRARSTDEARDLARALLERLAGWPASLRDLWRLGGKRGAPEALKDALARAARVDTPRTR